MNISVQTEGITVVGAENCPYCVKAKNVLKTSGMKFIYIDLDSYGNRKEYVAQMRATGLIPESAKTIPMIFVDGKYIGGYIELNKYLDQVGVGLIDDF